MSSLLLRSAAWAARALPGPIVRGLYRLGPLTRALRGLLTRAAPSGARVVRVAAGPLAGARLLLDLQVDKDLWLGTYEPELARALTTFATPGMTAYDIGANVGYTTLLLARVVAPDGRVIAFEPSKENQIRLRRALGLNPEGRRVSLINAAVGARSGRGRFLLHRHGTQGRLADPSDRKGTYAGEMRVPVHSLDRFVEHHDGPPPQLVKIDVEGGEAQVLRGMRSLLEWERPVIIVELHGPAAARPAWREARRAGYSLLHLRRGYPPVTGPDDMARKGHVIGLPGAR